MWENAVGVFISCHCRQQKKTWGKIWPQNGLFRASAPSGCGNGGRDTARQQSQKETPKATESERDTEGNRVRKRHRRQQSQKETPKGNRVRKRHRKATVRRRHRRQQSQKETPSGNRVRKRHREATESERDIER